MRQPFDPDNQVGRELTIRLTIKDHEASRGIWEHFKLGTHMFGSEVNAVADGDLFDERDKYKDIADIAMNDNHQSPDFDEPEKFETKCGKTFHWHPFGVYSDNERYYDAGEWFSSLENLKEKYEMKEDNGQPAAETNGK